MTTTCIRHPGTVSRSSGQQGLASQILDNDNSNNTYALMISTPAHFTSSSSYLAHAVLAIPTLAFRNSHTCIAKSTQHTTGCRGCVSEYSKMVGIGYVCLETILVTSGIATEIICPSDCQVAKHSPSYLSGRTSHTICKHSSTRWLRKHLAPIGVTLSLTTHLVEVQKPLVQAVAPVHAKP